MTTVRPAAGNDAAHIAQLMKQANDPKAIALTIYGCEGIAEFIEAQLSLPIALRDLQYVVASVSGTIAAFAEFKASGDAVHLNYICTARDRRGSGLARLLLSEGLNIVRQERHSIVLLDVFIGNADARDWYRRLGFNPVAATAWWRIPLTSGTTARGEVSGFAQAQACQASYGFSNFSLSTPSGTYSIGRLCSSWFKTGDPRVLEDDDAMACLAALDAGRELLCLLPAELPCKRIDGAERLQVADRMSIGIDLLDCNLMKRRGPT